MIVGFTIINLNGQEAAAIDYIQRVCILDNQDVAKNIVSVGNGVNVYSKGIILDELNSQPFVTSPIETKVGKYLLASAVNFHLELQYNGSTLRLFPTEYIYVSHKEAFQFIKYVEQGLVVMFPEVNADGSMWILEQGSWNDSGSWSDESNWRDS